MLFTKLIHGKYVKTFFVKDTAEYGEALFKILELLKENYALRLEFLLSNNARFLIWITKEYKAVLTGQTTNLENILNYSEAKSLMPMIIDVFVLDSSSYLADVETLSYLQKLYKYNVVSLTPEETRNLMERIMEISGRKEERKTIEYYFSHDLSRILNDVLVLSKIILYRRSLCSGTVKIHIVKNSTYRNFLNKIVEKTLSTMSEKVNSKETLIYAYAKIGNYTLRLLIDLANKCYGLALQINDKILNVDDVLNEPIKLSEYEREVKLKLKCIPRSLVES